MNVSNVLKDVFAPANNYKMINSAEIKNFRGYAKASLENCKRINLIVGENGSGKTSLLEALFLAAGGSVEIALRLRQLRGYDAGMAGNQGEIEDALWRDLFYKFDKKSVVSISLTGTEFRNRAMTIKFNDQNPNIVPIARKNANEDNVEVAPVTFDWIGPKGRKYFVKPKMKNGKIELPPYSPLPEETYFFSSGHNYSTVEMASRFSDLSKNFQVERVTEKLRLHFPAISELSLELIGGMPMVCAKYRDMPERVPLNLISSGMSKLAAILFAIASKRGSVLLVDEIENGIFHKRLPQMWESLLDFASETGSQVFASTHSAECIRAAAAVAEKHPDDFSVIQSNGKGGLHQFSGSSLYEAISEDIEIR